MDIFFILGIIGMFLILFGFFMIQTKRWSSSSLQYDIINILGGTLLIIYAIPPRVWPFIILNGVWVLVSLKAVITDMTKQKS